MRAIAISGCAVYVGGEFGTVGGSKRDSLARLDAGTGAVPARSSTHDRAGRTRSPSRDGRLYVGGTITAVDGKAHGRLAAFNLITGVLDAGWKPTADGTVESVVARRGADLHRRQVRRVNGVSGHAPAGRVDPSSGAVDAGLPADAGGHRVRHRGRRAGVYTAHRRAGRPAGAYSSTAGRDGRSTMDGDAQAITVLGEAVYIGGHFDNVCRSARTGDPGRLPRRQRPAGQAGGGRRATAATCCRWTANGNGSQRRAHDGGRGRVRFAAGGAFTTINGVIGGGSRSSAEPPVSARRVAGGLVLRPGVWSNGPRPRRPRGARLAPPPGRGRSPARSRRGGSTSRRCRRTAARCRSAGGRRCWRCRCGPPCPAAGRPRPARRPVIRRLDLLRCEP